MGLWPLRGRALLQLHTPDPVGILGMLYHLGSWATVLAILAAVASLVVRFRRARRAERQQLKWLFYWVAVLVVGFPITAVALDKVSSKLAADLVFALLIVPIPLAVGVAIVRHRPYDIDRLINRTLVYGLLTALLATVYAGVVLAQLFGGLGAEPPSWAIATATLTVATLFQPAHRRIQQEVADPDAARLMEQAAQHPVSLGVREPVPGEGGHCWFCGATRGPFATVEVLVTVVTVPAVPQPTGPCGERQPPDSAPLAPTGVVRGRSGYSTGPAGSLGRACRMWPAVRWWRFAWCVARAGRRT